MDRLVTDPDLDTDLQQAIDTLLARYLVTTNAKRLAALVERIKRLRERQWAEER